MTVVGMLHAISGIGFGDNPGVGCYQNPLGALAIIWGGYLFIPLHVLINHACIQKIWLICPILRVRTPLEDKTLEERYHMGSWHMFLPSEVCFGYCILWHCTWIYLSLKISGSHIDVRFASIYHYDQRLFRERFLGPPGVSWLWYMCNVQTAVNASYWPMIFLS